MREFDSFRTGLWGREGPAGNPRARADAKLAAGSLVTSPQMSLGKRSSLDLCSVGVWIIQNF